MKGNQTCGRVKKWTCPGSETLDEKSSF